MTGALVEHGFTPVDAALRRLEAVVSPRVGLVRGLGSTTYTPDETPLPNVACDVSSTRRTLGWPTVEYGGGAHPDARRARAAAIGEAIERYAGVFVPSGGVTLSTARELGSSAVEPTRFALFHDEQYRAPDFPFAPFLPDAPAAFVEGFSLTDGSPALLPADLVYLRRVDERCPPIGHSTSSGLACGATEDEAVLAALLEVVERDAVMLAWKCGLSLPLLDWSTHDELMALDRRFFGVTGTDFAVLDASCFLDVPVAISVLRGPPGVGAAIAVGGAAGATIADAWLKANAESFSVYRWLRQQAAAGKVPTPDAEAIASFEDHMLFYAADERAALARFLVASPHRRTTQSVTGLKGTTPGAQIRELTERLARHGIQAFAVDVTPPDVRSLGLSVMRVVVPDLCALDVTHEARYLGGERLATAAYDAGLVSKRLDLADLNPLPHPYP